MKQDTGKLPERAEELMRVALSSYKATVFWNMRPSMTVSGLKSSARALKTRGDLAATKLADDMLEALHYAP
ncbi:hypothetical protein [Pseudosulfitobacter pseudonitzschiae]|uniref:hypothetical protein n=1 Tax=Pseudosulfitobacter pseudonitzschiae TaxID=1402135 RepID=UPI003B818987